MQIVTRNDLNLMLEYCATKYNLKINFETEIFELDEEENSVIVYIYVDKIKNYRNLCEMHNWNHSKLTSWLQEIFDIYIVPYKLITIQIRFRYVWDTSDSIQNQFQLLNTFIR